MTAPLLEVRNVSHRYPGGVTSLERVSVTIAIGDVVGVAGGNGAGKSTLVRLLNGLLRPVAGAVLLDGADTRRMAVAALARSVGVVFQEPRSQLVSRTVREELELGPRHAGMAPAAVRERAAELAARLELDDVLGEPPISLPAPRRRLVAIAAVLAARPRVLVLDEPTTGQDRFVRDRMIGLMLSLRDEGTTVVCVAHDIGLLAEVSGTLLLLARGRRVACGPTRSVIGEPASLAEAGLRAPQVTRLAVAVPRLRDGPAILTVAELATALRAPGQAPS